MKAVVAQLVIGAVTITMLALHANAATAGFVFLTTILGIAVLTNLTTSLISSVVATLCYNYFFFPPFGTLAIREPANWVALISFFIASLISSRLVLRAELRRREVELQALQESDALKTSLLRAVSHDLATPLTAIAMQIDRLRSLVDGPAAEAAAEIAEHAGRLRRRIENLLAMARLESHTIVPRPEPTPAADLFRAAREQLTGHNRVIDVRVDDDCPDVYVDPSLALEILANLIENAHQASPAETPIELSAFRLDDDRVRLEILDHGPGLVPETDPSDTPRRGLGLEIARSLGTASGGAVTLANRPGGGAVARVDLPAAVLPQIAEVPA